jgi:hypothetical protein
VLNGRLLFVTEKEDTTETELMNKSFKDPNKLMSSTRRSLASVL